MKDIDPADFFNESYLIDYFDNHIRKKKGGGRDNLTPEKFWARYENEIKDIASKCLLGSYKFSFYNEKLVLKGRNKNPRILSIPSIRDRLVLGVLNNYLSRVFDDCVNHEVPNALINRIKLFLDSRKEDVYFLRTDFKNFYGSINLKLLMDFLSSRISDTKILKLIHSAITTPTLSISERKTNIEENVQGIPQGLAISNILAAIYMRSFDKEFGEKVLDLYIRYVDDILFLSLSPVNDLQGIIENEIKNRNLSLTLEPEKCAKGVVGTDSLDFLGYTIGKKIFIRKKSVTHFMTRVASLATRCKEEFDNPYKRPRFISKNSEFFEYYIEDFNILLSGFKCDGHMYGWLPYFQSITDVSSLYGMDRVIRLRILRNIPKEICDSVNSLTDTFHAIHRNSGGSMVRDYDALKTPTEKKHYLAKRGRLDAEKSYTDAQIEQIFNNYMDLIKKKSEQNIGEQS